MNKQPVEAFAQVLKAVSSASSPISKPGAGTHCGGAPLRRALACCAIALVLVERGESPSEL